MSKTRRSTMSALAILGAAGVGAFVLSSVAVSAATGTAQGGPPAVEYPFDALTVTGGVHPPSDSSRVFSVEYTSTFTLHPDSPGIASPPPREIDSSSSDASDASRTMADISVNTQVFYPVRADDSAAMVGPVGLPLATERLALLIELRGACLAADDPDAQDSYVLHGAPSDCASATLSLADDSWDLSSLFESLSAEFMRIGDDTWRGVVSATFESPGYAFPVSSLGGESGTTMLIGPNGGAVSTHTSSFSGGPPLVGPPTKIEECMRDGWAAFNNPTFRNQGDCVSYVASEGRNDPAG